MHETLNNLIKDTLSLLKDPLFEERAFFVPESLKADFSSTLPPPLKPPVSAQPALIKTPALPPSSPPPSLATNQIQNALQKILPSIRLSQTIPDDKEGKKVASLWKEKIEGIDVVLLALSNDSQMLDFLKNLAKAIHTHLAPCKIIAAERLETSGSWDLFFSANSFRLILISQGLSSYKTLPSFLKNTPHLLLEPYQVYKEINEKAKLWKTLCKLLPK